MQWSQTLIIDLPDFSIPIAQSEDQWADPSHEYLSAVLVSDVYHLYGYPTLSNKTSLPLEQPIAGRISHHVRIGKHDILPYDWNLYLQFANRELK